jgi:hypothetical protein
MSPCVLWIVGLCFFLVVQAQGTLNGTSYPYPRLSVTSNQDAFYVGQRKQFKLFDEL